jgi:hypothetical protein
MPARRALVFVLVPAKKDPHLARLELRLLFFASLISPPSETPHWVKISCYCQDGKSCSHNAVIRVYDEAGNVIETHEHAGEFKDW